MGAFYPAMPDHPNTALIPVAKIENDFYEWQDRHAAVLSIKDRINPDLVLIGDSITHLWAGEPHEPAGNRGLDSWNELFSGQRVLNLGFGFDRTQNVLYRMENGELDGLRPTTIILLIGTNNLPGTANARANSPAEVAEGIILIVDRLQKNFPETRLILMGLFPRGELPTDPLRAKIQATNQLIAGLALSHGVVFIDAYEKFLGPDGKISREVMGDFVHPTAKGYSIWAEALKPHLLPLS